ncbi:MAG: hypothetical protein ACOYEV_10785 [Candidatus Nanopelagicales bacterium]
MSLADGSRPEGDVLTLLQAHDQLGYLLAARLSAGERAGALPFKSRGGMLKAARWSGTAAKQMSRAGELINTREDLPALLG